MPEPPELPLVSPELPPLWAELAAFGAAESDAALVYLLRALCTMVGAQDAYWLGAVRMVDSSTDDPVCGWRPGAIRYLADRPDNDRVFKKGVSEIERGLPDITTIEHARRAGAFRAARLRDLVPPAWFDSSYYAQMYRDRGIVDTVWVICPVGPDAEAYYAWHRMEGHAAFTTADRDRLAAALLGIPWFHRQVMLGYGLDAAERPLTPTERQVLRSLLSDLSEKEIAASVGLAPRTTHHHITAIFRKFGVTSRTGLLAIWLGKGTARSSKQTPAD